jgi:NTE family protein
MFASDSFSPSPDSSSDSPASSTDTDSASAQTASAEPDSASSSSRSTDDATPMKAEAGNDDQVRSDDTQRASVQNDTSRADTQRGERAMSMKAAPRGDTTPAMAARQRDEFAPAPTPSRGMPALQPSAAPERAMTMGQSRRTDDATKAQAPAKPAPDTTATRQPTTPAAQPERAMTMGQSPRSDDATKAAAAKADAAKADAAKADAANADAVKADATKADVAKSERAATMNASRRSDAPVKTQNPAPVPLRSMEGYRQPTGSRQATSPTPPASRERAATMAAPQKPENAAKAEAPAKPPTPPSPPRQGGYRPGALWVDPVFNKDQIHNHVIDNNQFPDNKAPVAKPPETMDAALGKRPIQYTDASGKLRTASTPEEYKAQIAQNRRAAGVPELGGEPVGVHMAIQGGGGAGRRYPAALNEMAALGIVPRSASGASAGAITASFIAAGATPEQLTKIVQDKALADMMDGSLFTGRGGYADGQKAYDYFDSKLRELTGVQGRPVTFRDLPMPLQIIATKGNDSDKGAPDMSIPSNRTFVFSQETTPDTPVALAMRASMAIPGVFDPVRAVDPSTGHKIDFIDGGVVDNLPVGYNKSQLPTVGLAPYYAEYNHPDDNKPEMKRTYAGDSVGNWSIPNYTRGNQMNLDAAARGRDYRERTQPREGQFMLGVPTALASDPKKEDFWLDFGWDQKVDPALDKDTRGFTDDFFKRALPTMNDPRARATNQDVSIPKQLSFNRPVTFEGRTYDAMYSSSHLKGDTVYLRPRDGGATEVFQLGRRKIESMYIDDHNFGGNRIGGYMMDELRTRVEKLREQERAMGAMQ